MRVVVNEFMSLDGVVQAPGGPEEDTDGGFAHGGWSFPYGDQDFGTAMTGWFARRCAQAMKKTRSWGRPRSVLTLLVVAMAGCQQPLRDNGHVQRIENGLL